MSRKNYINPPAQTLPANAPPDAVHVYFASRLQQAMVSKGWYQSELARRAKAHLPAGSRIDRDNISTYIRGKALPGPVNLDAICKALGVKPNDLLPHRGVPSAADRRSSLEARDLGAGRAWLRVDQAVQWSVAVKVLAILERAGVTAGPKANDAPLSSEHEAISSPPYGSTDQSGTSKDPLLDPIELALKRHRLSDSRFGYVVAGDPALLPKMRNGRRIKKHNLRERIEKALTELEETGELKNEPRR